MTGGFYNLFSFFNSYANLTRESTSTFEWCHSRLHFDKSDVPDS